MPDDDIGNLREHIDAAHRAADRLVREAQERAERADKAFRDRLGDVPDRGWEVPGDADSQAPRSELQVIVSMLGAMREAIPEEISQQLAEAIRDLLLAVRSLIDWYLERLERLPGPVGGSSQNDDDRVQDIPIS